MNRNNNIPPAPPNTPANSPTHSPAMTRPDIITQLTCDASSPPMQLGGMTWMPDFFGQNFIVPPPLPTPPTIEIHEADVDIGDLLEAAEQQAYRPYRHR